MKAIIGGTLILFALSVLGDEVCDDVHDSFMIVRICNESGTLTRTMEMSSFRSPNWVLTLDHDSTTTFGPYAFSTLNLKRFKIKGRARRTESPSDVSSNASPKYTAAVSLLPNSFDGLLNLRHLQFNRVAINFIDGNPFEKFRTIVKLEIEFSNLTGIPTNRAGLPSNLKKLSLGYNQISEIPKDSFSETYFLRSLNLTNNRITRLSDLSKNFALPKSLKYLDLSGNGITHIEPGTLNGFMKLKQLFLSENDIRASPGLFRRLRSLEKLVLRGAFDSGEFQDQVGIFDDLSKLTHLDLSLNRIENIPEGLFQELGSLKTLDLSDNIIESIGSNDFKGIYVRELLLNDNSIKRIAYGSLRNAVAEKLDLRSNPVSDLIVDELKDFPTSVEVVRS